jgi:ProP effector
MSHSPKARNPSIAAVIELLAETWPYCFSIYENRRRPLKIGIHHDILAALDGAISAEELEQALRCYVSNKVYRARLATGAIRVGLEGLPAGTVAEKDALAAKPKPAKSVPQGGDRRSDQYSENHTEKTQSDIAALAGVTQKRLSLADLRAAAQARKLTTAEAVAS